MRHKYATPGIVLARTSLGEASVSLSLLTSELGLVRARVQGLRRSGAKLQSALQTFSEFDAVLVRGKEGWRISGAVPATNWFRMLSIPARKRVARIGTLLLRLVHGEVHDPRLFDTFSDFVTTLGALSEDEQETAECLVVLRLLHVLGHDAGAIPGSLKGYEKLVLEEVRTARKALIARVNHGIAASGL